MQRSADFSIKGQTTNGFMGQKAKLNWFKAKEYMNFHKTFNGKIQI